MLHHQKAVHESVKKYTCPYCVPTWRTHNIHDYTDHMAQEHGQGEKVTYQCEKCRRKFKNCSSLLKHQKVIMCTKKKTHPCADPCCVRKFKRAVMAKVHFQKYHAGKLKGYKCTKCGRRLTSKSGMYSHRKLHHAKDQGKRRTVD